MIFSLGTLSPAGSSAGERVLDRRHEDIEKLGLLVKDKKQSDKARIKGAGALAESNDEKAPLPLFDVIKDSGERAIFRAAVERELVRSPQKAKVAAFFAERIKDMKESPEVRAAAAEGIGQLKISQSRNLLVRASSDKDPKVRLAAGYALLELGGEGIDRTSILIKILQDLDQTGYVRASAAKQLGVSKDERALPALIKALQEKSSEPAPPVNPSDFFARRAALGGNVPIAAARALGRLGDPKAIPALLSVAQTPQDELRINVFEALAELRAVEAVPAARKALSDANHRVRRWAGVLLKEVGSREALPDLRRALSDPDPGVRLQAAQAIEKMQDQESREQLKNALDKETVPEVREALDKAIRSPKGTPSL